ncbi:methyltransferase, partial [Mesorhizobium sp. M1D.F.Ca.ET.183.01.1.1]|uniref:methyltransferase n=1 Tax=Mesorhizobium sp. M1D.F.Ca.ET.183.01.1.1 TaxID=2496666 RepID=UPI00125176E2
WTDESCLRLLANSSAAMKPEPRLLVIERLLETTAGCSLPMNFLSDMHMMTLFPGARERTPEEFSRLFRESGLREPKIIPTRSPFGILETGLA